MSAPGAFGWWLALTALQVGGAVLRDRRVAPGDHLEGLNVIDLWGEEDVVRGWSGANGVGGAVGGAEEIGVVDEGAAEVDMVDAELRSDAAEPVTDGGIDFGLAVDGLCIEEEGDAFEDDVEVAPLAREAGSRTRGEISEALAEGGHVDIDGGHPARIPLAVCVGDGGEERGL